ncbi:MAG: hypothetical protein PHU53_03200 [Thermoplasmata archaeon]|nr:hypothetical protein [Thermoplasmata archaeon]
MGNQLTHGLLAAALMTMANVFLGLEPITWAVFLAWMSAILLGFDSADSRFAEGSPAGHSIGFGLFIIYMSGTLALAANILAGVGGLISAQFTLAIASGITAHLLARIATGGQVFTFPRNLRPVSWFVRCDDCSSEFWSAWGRFSLKGRHLGNVHLNAFSLVFMIGCIALF